MSKAKDRADSPLCRALGREEAQVPNIERCQKLGAHHDVPLRTTASQARHAPRLRLMLTRYARTAGETYRGVAWTFFLRLLRLFAAIVFAFKDQNELRIMSRQPPTELSHPTLDRTIDPAVRRDIIVGVLLAMFLAALDQTIVAPALPTIGSSLGNAEYLSWIVTAYLLTATAVTPLYGKLADIKGRRPVIFGAIAIFVAGSIISALARSMLVLVIGRAIQGIGGGGLGALAMTVIGDVVTPRERGQYQGYISGMWGIASLAGPIVGGFVAHKLHWSMIFWINLPLAAIAIAFLNNPLKKLPPVRGQHRLDLLGASLVILATTSLMLVLTWGGSRYAWTSPQILGLTAVSLVFWVLFGLRIQHCDEPILPLEVLKNPVVANA